MEGNGREVLLVDDDAFLLDLYARKFENNGFVPVKANTADEALEKLRGGLSPHIIVFDIVMPHIDGYGFLEAMQKEKLAPGAVKVALSNQTQDDDVDRAKALGADGYIAKAAAIPSKTIESVLEIVREKRDQEPEQL